MYVCNCRSKSTTPKTKSSCTFFFLCRDSFQSKTLFLVVVVVMDRVMRIKREVCYILSFGFILMSTIIIFYKGGSSDPLVFSRLGEFFPKNQQSGRSLWLLLWQMGSGWRLSDSVVRWKVFVSWSWFPVSSEWKKRRWVSQMEMATPCLSSSQVFNFRVNYTISY